MKTVYVDTYILAHYTANLAVFYLTSKFLHMDASRKKLALTSFLGAFLALAVEILPYIGHFRPLASLIICAACVRVCFGKRKKTITVRAVMTCYIFSFVLAGVVGAVSGFLPSASGGFAFASLVISCTLLLLVSGKPLMFYSKASHEKSAGVLVEIGHRQGKFTVLCDSGNLLCDPLFSRPVLLLKSSAKNIFFEKNKVFPLLPISFSTAGGRGEAFLCPGAGVSIKVKKEYKKISASLAFCKDDIIIPPYDGILPHILLDNL